MSCLLPFLLFREHIRELREVANDYVDAILEYAHTYIEQNNLAQIAIPNVDAGFSKKVSHLSIESAEECTYLSQTKLMTSYCPFQILWVTWHGRFWTSEGSARNLATVRRTGDISLSLNQETGAITVFGSVGLAELSVSANTHIHTHCIIDMFPYSTS
jgi:hypothetical protein